MALKDYESQAREILNGMSLRDKVTFCVGKDFWHLHGNEKFGLPEIMVTDGPHGLRKQEEGSDNLGLIDSVPSTCFPTASATAASFDTELMYEMGEALGEECVKEEVAVLLGPAVNHKRSPLCGRNFEYVSEDPYLTGKMAASLIRGIQSKKVGTSVKHYAANNQEKARMCNESIVDERALMEIYLKQFEIIIKESQPATIMNSYNKLNGDFASESKFLMQDMARYKWGYEGVFVTDWGALNGHAYSYKNGLDLEMPGLPQDRIDNIIDAVQHGYVSKERVDESALKMIELILQYKDSQVSGTSCNMNDHLALARKVAGESMVLLKNTGKILPLDTTKKIGVIGSMAVTPRYQGAGSSKINPYKLDNAAEGFREAGIEIQYSEGYIPGETKPDEMRMKRAEALAKECDTVIVFAGLPDSFESEGFDRTTMDMPESHNELILRVSAVNKNVIVVLQTGSPVKMPWLGNVKAVLLSYLSGCQGGKATVDVLTGKVNPSGRLAETFPLSLEHTPCYKYFANDKYYTKYKESIFTGYRYYDTAEQKVLFPFGHGLSYTSFEYSNMNASTYDMTDNDTVKIWVDVTNTGDVFGKEVVQLYVAHENPSIFKAKKELKAFTKVSLQPGETKTVEFELDKSAFAYYNVNIHDWHVESGDYTVYIAKNVNEVCLDYVIHMKSTVDAPIPDYRLSAPSYYNISKGGVEISDYEFEMLYGKTLCMEHTTIPFTRNTTIGELAEATKLGSMLYNKVMDLLPQVLDEDNEIVRMATAMIPDMPLRVARMGLTVATDKAISVITDIFNGRPKLALWEITKKSNFTSSY